jgi:hypothetical protein
MELIQIFPKITTIQTSQKLSTLYIYLKTDSSNRYTSKKINTKNIQDILNYLIS